MEKSINESFVEVINYFTDSLKIDNLSKYDYSSLSLALMGDAIYDLFIRYYVMSFGDDKVNNIHGKKSFFVKAKSQAQFIDYYKDQLTEEEYEVYRRGRNKKSNTAAKNSTIVEYRKSTGFEALLGYLFIKNDYQRIITIIDESIKFQRGNRGK